MAGVRIDLVAAGEGSYSPPTRSAGCPGPPLVLLRSVKAGVAAGRTGRGTSRC